MLVCSLTAFIIKSKLLYLASRVLHDHVSVSFFALISYYFFFSLLYSNHGLPWWLSGKESTYQCKRHGFDTCLKKILISQDLCTITSFCLETCLPRSCSVFIVRSQLICHLLIKACLTTLSNSARQHSFHHSLSYDIVSFLPRNYFIFALFILLAYLSFVLLSWTLHSTKVRNLADFIHFCIRRDKNNAWNIIDSW